MPKSTPDLSRISVDEIGRVVVPDDVLAAIDECFDIISAGGSNSECHNANGGCSNEFCQGSANSECLNVFCDGATNFYNCRQDVGDG